MIAGYSVSNLVQEEAEWGRMKVLIQGSSMFDLQATHHTFHVQAIYLYYTCSLESGNTEL